jgi:hypothetical protein
MGRSEGARVEGIDNNAFPRITNKARVKNYGMKAKPRPIVKAFVKG